MGRGRKCLRTSLMAPSHVIEISEAENGQKVVNFKVIYLGK